MFEKLVEVFFKKEYVKVNECYFGLDAWGNPKYQYDWATKYSVKKNALAGMIAAVGVTVGVIVSSFMAFGETETESKVEEITTTTVVVEETVIEQEQKVYGPEWAKQDLYVCNSNFVSNEWKLLEIFTGYEMSQVDWKEMASREVVFEWKAGDILLPAFEKAVALLIEYTRANVRVVYGNTPLNGEYVIPVTKKELRQGAAGMVTHSYDSRNLEDNRNEQGQMITTGLLVVAATRMEIDPMMEQEIYEYGLVSLFLHEIGHVYGLDHTHEEEGEQLDSVMSYESDAAVSHYLPGDIAGLKEVFC